METLTGGDQTTAPTTGHSSEEVAYLHVIADYLYDILIPIILILGVVGNLLTILIMTSKPFRSSSVAVYFSVLPISDSLVLILDFLNNWVGSVPKINLMGLSDGFCKFHRFFFNVVYVYSAWLVTAVCIERFIVVWFPFKAKQICSYRKTVIAVSVMPIPISAIYLYNIWTWYAYGNDCVMLSSWYDFQSYISPWISAFTYSYCPVIIMVILNTAILGKLALARKSRRQMSSEASANEKKESRITVTIVVICVFYVIMTVPLSIYYTLAFKYDQVC